MTDYRDKTIAILGANGFIGRNLVAALRRQGVRRVIAVSRSIDYAFFAAIDPAIFTANADLGDAETVARLGADWDVVVDLVASATPRCFADSRDERINSEVQPHRELYDRLMRRARPPALMYASSGGAVYNLESDRVSERDPTHPVSGYGRAKLLVEQYIRGLPELSYMILRPSNPYGHGQHNKRGQGLISAIFQAKLAGRPIQIYGDGEAVRDYIYIDDVTAAMVAGIVRLAGGPCRITLNVGSGVGLATYAVIAACEALFEEALAIERRPAMNSDVRRNVLAIKSAREFLGWQPRVSFNAGLRQAWAYWLAHESAPRH